MADITVLNANQCDCAVHVLSACHVDYTMSKYEKKMLTCVLSFLEQLINYRLSVQRSEEKPTYLNM